MKVYLAVPLSRNRDIAFTNSLREAILQSGHVTTSDYVLKENIDDVTSAEVFERDFKALIASDAIVADLTHPSTGVGIELGFAHLHNKKIILVIPDEKTRLSKLALGIPGIIVVRYKDTIEATEKLKAALRELTTLN